MANHYFSVRVTHITNHGTRKRTSFSTALKEKEKTWPATSVQSSDLLIEFDDMWAYTYVIIKCIELGT